MLLRFRRKILHLARRLPILTLTLLAAGCAREAAPPKAPPVGDPEPTRGLVLVSVDTLRADHLGIYGHSRDTSPRLDALARRGVVFDLAFAHSPSTLISHMSAFTSLLPPEHGVKPPKWSVLSPDIPTLPEALRTAGFRTAGFTEGGYMEGDHGFSRGFDQWQDPGFEASTDIEETFELGLDFLRSVQSTTEDGKNEAEPFFLFLHTYSVHDPYEPPQTFRHTFWDGDPPTPAPADASTLEEVNSGRRDLGETEADYFASRYDDGIRYFDGVFGHFLDQIDALGLTDEVTLVLMSDHGEEFLDHGRMLHTQVYPELLRVPLVVVHPRLPHRRVGRPVALVDLAPTLLDLAKLDPASMLPDARGRSLVPELTGRSPSLSPPEREPSIYGEVEYVDAQRSLLVAPDGPNRDIWQIVERRPTRDPDGYWISRRVEFDVEGRRVGLRLASFEEPRRLTVDWIGTRGTRRLEERDLPPTWTEMEVRPPDGDRRGRLRLSVDDCSVPRDLGLGEDPRCLGFMIAEPEPLRVDVLRLRLGREGRLDVAQELTGFSDVRRELQRRLAGLRFDRLATPSSQELDAEERRALEALGYL